MKVLSLFDGISCGMVALERAGVTVDMYLASEIKPAALACSKENYPQIIHNITTPEDKHISYQDYKDMDETYCDMFITPKTPSREKMWGDGINGVCKNVTHCEKIGCLTTKQDRWRNSGLVEYKGFCRYLTTRELEIAQTLPVGYTKMLTKTQSENVLGDCWTVDVIAHIFKGLREAQE